jgi:hypothetical protein
MDLTVTDVECKEALSPELPDWLTPALTREQVLQNLQSVQYNIVFERVLENIAAGNTLKSVLKNDLREIEYGAFLRWVNKDPDRRRRYQDAKELRTETWAGEIIEIADAADSLEDVNRSKLRIDSRKWLMGADYQRVYGDRIVQQVEGADGGPVQVAMAVFTPSQLMEYAMKKIDAK